MTVLTPKSDIVHCAVHLLLSFKDQHLPILLHHKIVAFFNIDTFTVVEVNKLGDQWPRAETNKYSLTDLLNL